MPFSGRDGGNIDPVMITMIEELKGEANGQLIDRGRVIDHLLDLRSAASDQEHLVTLLDSVLAELPGQTVVETEWWRATLDRLADEAQPEPVV
ncbi:MAG: hypothetical protein ACI8TP_002235 [Acidimicrobiales bacterium]|jgi:hypothetical protein